MQELEKILEEIEAEHPYKIPGDCDSYSQYNEAWQDAIDRVRGRLEIFFKERTNDGWIPVEEALPEEGQEAWVTENTDCVRRGTYTEIFGSAMRKGFICSDGFMYIGNAFAWQPYIVPEPYRPERRYG